MGCGTLPISALVDENEGRLLYSRTRQCFPFPSAFCSIPIPLRRPNPPPEGGLGFVLGFLGLFWDFWDLGILAQIPHVGRDSNPPPPKPGANAAMGRCRAPDGPDPPYARVADASVSPRLHRITGHGRDTPQEVYKETFEANMRNRARTRTQVFPLPMCPRLGTTTPVIPATDDHSTPPPRWGWKIFMPNCIFPPLPRIKSVCVLLYIW